MIEAMAKPVQGQPQWCAERLLECLQDMGSQQTNAVLLTLQGVNTITPYQHYPQQPYDFGAGHWRAFYHSHDSNIIDQREHGHYHFFTREHEEQDWAHVVALGVDHQGLPISLFTTNRWVTDGSWFDADALNRHLHYLMQANDAALPVRWFKYMLLLYREQVSELLQARDAELRRLCPQDSEHCLIDRSIYYLSMLDIDLNKQLFSALRPSAILD